MRLPLEVELPLGAELVGTRGCARRAATDHDLPRIRGLLKPGCDIDRVSGDDEVTAFGFATCDHLAGIDANPDREPVA